MKLPKNLNPLSPPYEFQIEAIGYGVIKDHPGLLLPVGCGKTYCSINICKWRMQNSGVNKILVLCPASIMLKWKEEIFRFSGHDSIILHNPTKNKRIEKIEHFRNSSIPFGIINYEALYPYYKHLSKINLDMIVADESARYIKNLVSSIKGKDGKTGYVKRTTAAIWLGDKAKYRMILTGTLITNKPLDIWSQFRFLDVNIFGSNFWIWRNYFFRKVNYGRFNKWEIKKNEMDYLSKRIFSTCIIFKKKDILKDLPETINVIIPIRMNDELSIIYNKVQSKIIAEIETEMGTATVNIPHIFTKLIRLQQITSGYIKDEDEKLRNLREMPKLEALLEEIESILREGESGIVWCRFRYTISLISSALTKKKIKHVVITGSDSAKQKGEKWKGFQKSKTINIFVGQVEAGGIGIELFKIDSEAKYQHVFFIENTFVMDHREQAIGRTEQRIGQKSACRIVDFLVRDTIDEKIFDSIMKNKMIADEIMSGGIREWLK